MLIIRLFLCFIITGFLITKSDAQVMINEGSNRNYLAIADEDGDYPDWIELYNAGTDTVDLLNYSLTDKLNNPVKWTLPNVKIAPGGFRIVFCSGKNRKPVTGFIHVVNTGTFTPVTGWNQHTFTTPFYWDGVSNLLINTCSYCSTGYTTNSEFNQTSTPFLSTTFSFQDGSNSACYAGYGTPVYQRPNIKLNNVQVGTGTIHNSPYDYPAPYGNWYWGAKNQMLILASELISSGLTPGFITNLAFDVFGTNPNTVYDYIDIHMKLVSENAMSSAFAPVNPNNFLHTNFKISKSGETIYLFSPDQIQLSSLLVSCNDLDISTGRHPDGNADIFLFRTATPSASNNSSWIFTGYLEAPVVSIPSGFYSLPVNISITNLNSGPTSVHYTLDGSDPTISSPLYTGTPVIISSSKVLKARVFANEVLPSPIVAATYFFNVEHTTPIISVITDPANLYGSSGIFDNWWQDWERAAYTEYFDSTQQMIFSQKAGIQIDGGWGGSRYHPQHSFRIELDDGVLGEAPVNYPLIPNRPDRSKYSKFYLRNGSNQYLVFPYKDACQVQMMAGETYNYYSAWRPVSVYINGSYFGLYELREKFDTEFFELLDGADPNTMDILSQSAWYGGALRAVEGSVDSFFESYNQFLGLNPTDTNYWTQADQYFDMLWYTDYIIGESWMGNNDWPWNNIKIYRSDKTDFRWRFCIIDLELSMEPNGWTNCYFDHIGYMLSQSSSIPYINIWLKSMQNLRYKYYFINRFADIMNTAYRNEKLIAIENNFYSLNLPEMPNEYARWGDPNNINQQMIDFQNNHDAFQNQISLRTQQVRNHIQMHFALPNKVNVTLNVEPEGAGKIKISTIIPDDYPWTGVYFNGVPVKIEAFANEGYFFSHWSSNSLITDTLNPIFQSNLNATTILFKANFESLTTSIFDNENYAAGFTIYPNPASNQLTIVNNNFPKVSEFSYEITDLTGRTLLHGKVTGIKKESIIDIQSLPPSVYMLRIIDADKKVFLNRFIKIDK